MKKPCRASPAWFRAASPRQGGDNDVIADVVARVQRRFKQNPPPAGATVAIAERRGKAGPCTQACHGMWRGRARVLCAGRPGAMICATLTQIGVQVILTGGGGLVGGCGHFVVRL